MSGSFVFVNPPVGVERKCSTCAHRAYGDQRLVSQCALKVQGDYQRRAFIDNHGSKPPKPRAHDFGAKCLRWQSMEMFKHTPLGREIESLIAASEAKPDP